MFTFRTIASIFVLVASTHAAAAEVPTGPFGLLGFETRLVEGIPCGWDANPRYTAFVDDAVKHGGARALRLVRTDTIKGDFTWVSGIAPVDFSGRDLELRGRLRVKGGSASLWLRQDAEKPVQFASGEALTNTGAWTARSIMAKLDPAAKKLVFGLRYSGGGWHGRMISSSWSTASR